MIIDSLTKLDIYFALALNGVFTGLGTAVGSYFANRHVIEKSRKLIRRIKRKR